MNYSNKINNFIKTFTFKSKYNNPPHNNRQRSSNKLFFTCIIDYIDDFNSPIPTFQEFIYQKIATSAFKTESNLYKNAMIDRKRWHDLINNKSERPHKDLLFKIAISLKLSMEDTDTLLATKGYCITPNRYRDKVLCYFLSTPDGIEILNLPSLDRNNKINELLEEMHQSPLYSFE